MRTARRKSLRRSDIQPTASQIQDQLKKNNKLLQHFWYHWRQEYLTSLCEFYKASGKNEIEIDGDGDGDVFQLHEAERVIEGKDGLIQAADIKTSICFTNRPIAKLYPLEVTSTIHTTTALLTCSVSTKPTKPTRLIERVAQVKLKMKRIL